VGTATDVVECIAVEEMSAREGGMSRVIGAMGVKVGWFFRTNWRTFYTLFDDASHFRRRAYSCQAIRSRGRGLATGPIPTLLLMGRHRKLPEVCDAEQPIPEGHA
jgi:hypothetical protein